MSESGEISKATRSDLVNRAVEKDAVLIEGVLNGDDSAFGVLMRRYSPLLLGYLCGRTNGMSDTEDLMQEIFLSAYRNLHTLRKRELFGPWLLRIARNRLFDHIRKLKSERGRGAQEVSVELDNVEARAAKMDTAADPMQEASYKETCDLVMQAIGKLNDKYRTILYMRLIGEEMPQEIARQLALKESTVRMRLSRGLKKLRKLLQAIR